MRDLTSVSEVLSNMIHSTSEAFTLISDLGPPNAGESLSDIHTRLLVTRSVMTNVSETVASLVRVRSMVRQEQIERKGELDDAVARVASEPEKPSFVENYDSAMVSNAKINAKTLSERIALREADIVAADVEGAYEYVRNRLWELDRAVRDVDTRLRIVSFEPGDF